MESQKLKSEVEYRRALQRFEMIFLSKKDTKESNEADELAKLIHEYEDPNIKTKGPQFIQGPIE